MRASKRTRRCLENKGGGGHSEDRISLLPDDLIDLILSFLSLKEAVATGVLSRRWRHMWASTRRLEFVFKDWRRADLDSRWRKRYNRYVKGVNQVLRLHKGSTLEEFRVASDLNENFKGDIDKWLAFASAKRVQRLELDFSLPYSLCNGFESFDQTSEYYNLSYGVVDQANGNSLKTLSSNFCRINCRDFCCFESLKVLCLRRVNVTGEVLEGFLSCCPSLEKLTVERSMGLVHLKVQGPSLVLKYLEIRICLKLLAVEICNVNLVTLVYAGRKINWVLHNAPALVDLTIGTIVCRPLNNLMLTQLSCCFSQLETLTIESGNYKGSGFVEEVDMPIEFSNLKKLVLNLLMINDNSVIGYTPLIKASPKLQRFVLESRWANPTFERREIRRVKEKLNHQHIEEVEFRGYIGNKTQLELLIFFLENAVSLKKIILDTNEVYLRSHWMERSEDIESVQAAKLRAMKQLKRRMIRRKMQQGVEIEIL